MALNTIEEIIDDIRKGKMVILMDDEDRENEGDLIMAASMIRPEDINFMARYGRGLICLTLTRERCQQLKLPLMVSNTNDKHGTNFTVSIEAAQGVTTGISAYDRAITVRAAVAPNAGSEDIVQPGHIFPLMAHDNDFIVFPCVLEIRKVNHGQIHAYSTNNRNSFSPNKNLCIIREKSAVPVSISNRNYPYPARTLSDKSPSVTYWCT